METTKLPKTMMQMIDERLPGIKGKWRLMYKAKGSRGIENFGGVTIHDYQSPMTHQPVYRRDGTGKVLPTYFMDKPIKDLYPDRNVQDKLDVAWLLHSPQVVVQGYDQVPEYYLEQKIDSANIYLVAVDYQELNEIEQDDYVDKLIGRISEEGGRNAIGLDRLRKILSAVGLSYRDQRYSEKPSTEKSVLKKRLKTFIRAKYDNAKEVNKILANMEYYEVEFLLKEMVRMKVIVQGAHGVYKYNEIPFGTHLSSVIDFWHTAPEIKVEMEKELAKKLN